MINEKSELSNALLELFKYAFITNCHLDNDSITLQESNTIESFNPVELLENFKDLIINLLTFKKQNKEKPSVFSSETVESLKKTHEKELQYHLRLEKELKFQIENAKIREKTILTNLEKSQQKMKDLQSENFAFEQFAR